MSLIYVAGTSAFGLLTCVSYDVIFKTMVGTVSRIINTAYYLTEKKNYPKIVTDKIYELDLTAKIALVNVYLQKEHSDHSKSATQILYNSFKTNQLNDSQTQTQTQTKTQIQTKTQTHTESHESIEIINDFDVLVAGDNAYLNKLIDECREAGNLNPSIINLLYLQQSLVKIENIMLYIKRLFDDHQKLWFSSWRNLDLKRDLHQLELETKILENRVKFIAQLKSIPSMTA